MAAEATPCVAPVDEGRPRTSRRPVVVAAFVVLSCVGAWVRVTGPPAALRTALIAHNTSRGDIMFGKNGTDWDVTSAIDLNCSAYNDDDVYTNTSCAVYDKESCGLYCYEDSWCEHFCGDECEKGGGAICALTVLSNLTKTCEFNGLCSAPGGDSAIASSASTLRASGDGCDHHAICTYCLTDDFCQELVLDGVIADANMAMLLLSELEMTCNAYGCSSWEGRRLT